MSANTAQHSGGKNKQYTLTGYVNYGEEDEMEIYGYKRNLLYTTCAWLCILMTMGFVQLIFHWYPQICLYSTHKKCSLQQAEKLLIVENYQGKYKMYYIKAVKRISAANTSVKDEAKRGGLVNVNHSQNGVKNTLKFRLATGSSLELEEFRAVSIKKLLYVWDEASQSFIKLAGLDKGVSTAELHGYNGFDTHQQFLRQVVYGNNEIIAPVESVLKLLLLEIFTPFYIFLIFTLCVWMSENYYYYTVAIIIMTVFGVSSSILQTRTNQKNLHDTIASVALVNIYRGEDIYEEVSSTTLVPGDIIIIPSQGCEISCDAVLLNGNCIVNESMLTGECVPVTKTPIPCQAAVMFDSREDAPHTLFCGTKVIQTRTHGSTLVKAVVIRTGYMTAKGSLVRSILYPPPADFKFDQDSYKFIGVLAIIAAIGLIYTVIMKSEKGISPSDIAIKALDIITIVIPPALPAAMTVGKLYAQNRLKALNIFCMNSRVINVCGSINCVCFDKTGTLTEDGLDMWGVIPKGSNQFKSPLRDVSQLSLGPLLFGMVSCHSNTIIDNKVSGDPLDIKMFESTRWILEEPEFTDTSRYGIHVSSVVRPPESILAHNTEVPMEIGIIHQYQFSSTLQRMSVITRMLGTQEFIVFCKGSPEMIISLSLPHTVPPDVLSILENYTEKGYRVIALGMRTLDDLIFSNVEDIKREDVEKQLEFLGLVVLENRLKPETKDVISILRKADINVVMITGDNILTALSVARECGIIQSGEHIIDVSVVDDESEKDPEVYFTHSGRFKPQEVSSEIINGQMKLLFDKDPESINIPSNYRFALTGKSWQLLKEHFPEVLQRVVVKGVVFARMSSDQKQQLVQEFQELGYYVAMCGDGANDCGALKAAHAGISLSEAESSVASPFTSREPNISCVPIVIREGRAALSTSFGIFKFMVAYSLTEFLSAIILYNIESNLSDLEFLFIDICLIVNFAFFYGKTEAYSGPLVKTPPLSSLLSLAPMVSLTLQLLVNILFQGICFYLVRLYPWYHAFNYDSLTSYACYENYAVFCVSLFQYITLAVVFSEGAPYRKPIYTNKTLTISLMAMTLISIYITVYPAQWVIRWLELQVADGYGFRIITVAIGFAGFFLGIFLERFFVKYALLSKFPKLSSGPKIKYEKLKEELVNYTDWPPITSKLPPMLPTPASEIPPEILTEIQFQISNELEGRCIGGVENESFENDEINITKL